MDSIEQGATDSDGDAAPVEVADTHRLPDQQLLDSWVGERLRRALADLAPGYRIVVVLREIEGLSTREVASVTGLSEANVKQRLHRARMLLRQSLGDV
jgi:RNA polymerase sigma-70 factor (ECF subfamily)